MVGALWSPSPSLIFSLLKGWATGTDKFTKRSWIQFLHQSPGRLFPSPCSGGDLLAQDPVSGQVFVFLVLFLFYKRQIGSVEEGNEPSPCCPDPVS